MESHHLRKLICAALATVSIGLVGMAAERISILSPTNGEVVEIPPGQTKRTVALQLQYNDLNPSSTYGLQWDVDHTGTEPWTGEQGSLYTTLNIPNLNAGQHTVAVFLNKRYWFFDHYGWSMVASASVTFTVVQTYNVTVRNSFDAGNVKVDNVGYPSGSQFIWRNGSNHSLEATEDGHNYGGYVRRFDNWSGPGVTPPTGISITITVYQNATYTANFKPEFDITFQNNFAGGGNGGVIKVNGTQYNSPTSSFPVVQGNSITGEAVNQTLNSLIYTFTQWSDGSTSNPRTFTPTGHMTYTANFAVKPTRVTVISAGGQNYQPVVLTWQVHPNPNVTYDIWLRVRENGVTGDPMLQASSLPHNTTSYTSDTWTNIPLGTKLLYWDVRAYHPPTGTSADPFYTCSGYGQIWYKATGDDASKAQIGEEVHQFGVSNYPNPFNPTTTIKFSLPDDAQVSLEIFNTLGERVRTLIHGEVYQAGSYNVMWDGKDSNGRTASSGMYFYRIVAGQNVKTVKMLLMK